MFDFAQLGATLTAEPYAVTREAISAFAAATNDEHPEHRTGRLAPPLFAVVPALKLMAEAKRRVTPLFTLHAAHQIARHRPIVPGMSLAVRAVVTGIHDSPAGGIVTVRGEISDLEGPVNTQYLVVLAHGHRIDRSLGDMAPGHRTPDGATDGPPDAEAHQTLDADQTRRYAEASGDRSDYTFDAEAARAKGLAGPIVHGLCTMAFLGRVIVAHACAGDSRRLRRLAVRFTHPLIMREGQALTTRLWSLPRPGAWAAICLDADGAAVIRHGLAEIGPGVE